MQLDRQLGRTLHGADQFGCFIRKQQTCHILDTDGICTHIFDFFCDIGPVIQSVCIAKRIGKGYLSVSFFLVAGFYCAFQVTQVV